LLDRIADEEEAAERQGDAAGPDHPLGAEALLEADFGFGRRCNRRRGDRFGRGRSRFARGVGHRFRQRARNGLGRSRFAAGAGKARLEPGDAELEPLDALARAHRHDDADDGENRDGENGDDDRGDHAGSGLAGERRGGTPI